MMKASISLEFSGCSLTGGETPQDSYSPPDFFTPPTQEEKRRDYDDIDETRFVVDSKDVPREQARAAYADLRSWNREKHTDMVGLLEPLFLNHIERAANFIILHPYEIKRMAGCVPVHQVPYRFAGLPPNLFDHLDPGKPFLPQTKQDVLDLINGFQTYNERLRRLEGWEVICNGKEDFYRDIGLDLLRRQRTDPDLFTTTAEQEKWSSYNQAFKDSDRKRARPTFHQSVIAANYMQNRQYSQTSGFFDKTDGMFDAFLLTDFYPSRGAITSQIRVPFMYGHESRARDLLKSTHILMQLLTSGGQLEKEGRKLSLQSAFLGAHLTRSQELETIQPTFYTGLNRTALEGVAAISALFAECEADGIPGFEDDYWGGLNAMLDGDVPVKITANAPPSIVMPPTLHGNRFERILTNSKNGLLVRPEVAEKIQQMHDRQTVALHAKWLAYLNRPNREALQPPVRFGLHCPLKNNVVRQMAETLILCRAAIHTNEKRPTTSQ